MRYPGNEVECKVECNLVSAPGPPVVCGLSLGKVVLSVADTFPTPSSSTFISSLYLDLLPGEVEESAENCITYYCLEV